MFDFFNKWKRAGKGVGISGGAGKLCAFDKDGNVISSGFAAADVSKHLYQHTITLLHDIDEFGDYNFTYLSTSSSPVMDWETLLAVTNVMGKVNAWGYIQVAGSGGNYTLYPVEYVERVTGDTPAIRFWAEWQQTSPASIQYFAFESSADIASMTDSVKQIF